MPDYNEVQNSGQMESFKTGSVRDSRKGKGRCDLVPVHGYLRLAKHYENGAVKYGDRNWEKGQPQSRYLDSALRHLMKHLGGDRSEDHLAACAWNCFAMMEQEEKIERGLLPKELNDLPPSVFRENEFIEKSKEAFVTGTTVELPTEVGKGHTDIPKILQPHTEEQKRIADLLKRYDETVKKQDSLTNCPHAVPEGYPKDKDSESLIKQPFSRDI